MMQRFLVRLGAFSLLSMVGSFFLLRLLDSLSFPLWLGGTLIVLSLVYSGRLLAGRLGPAFGTLLKFGFVALLFGSIPGVIVILVLLACLWGVLPLICLAAGAVQILMELLEAIRLDHP